jgi:hypothetical protein
LNHLSPPRLALLGAALAVCLLALPAQAASSAASSASDSVTTSMGSLSASVNQSSRSSSGDKVAQGDYTIIEMASAPGLPGMVALRLQAVADSSEAGALTLTLPQAAVTGAYLRTGLVVTAQDRPYGTEFSSALTRQAFFLALNDAWTQDLKTSVVTL